MADAIDKSRGFVASQFQSAAGGGGARRPRLVGPAVTMAHQTGAGAHEVARRLAEILTRVETKGAQPWTILDREVVERALEEHHWPSELARKMPEDRRSYVDDVLDDLFGLRPPSWVLVPQVVETMLHLAEAGHVVLIGRGASVVTMQLPNVLHVRLVGSLERRIERVQTERNLEAEEAAEVVAKEDRRRQRYVKANFHARVEDPLLYHLVVNTDRLSYDAAAEVIAEAAVRCFEGWKQGGDEQRTSAVREEPMAA